jgi:hypothetical protein
MRVTKKSMRIDSNTLFKIYFFTGVPPYSRIIVVPAMQRGSLPSHCWRNDKPL